MIDWARIHAAFGALDLARVKPDYTRIGYDYGTDPLGGSYYGPYWESRGLPAAVQLVGALQRITQASWKLVHGAADRVREITAAPYAQPRAYIALYRHGRHLFPVMSGLKIRAFNTHRGAAIAANVGAKQSDRRGEVRLGSEYAAMRVARIHEEVRTAVRTMLAAREAYDALAAAGLVEQATRNCITCGCADDVVHVTGLRWLAGEISEGRPVTVAAAQRFASGEPIRQALGLA